MGKLKFLSFALIVAALVVSVAASQIWFTRINNTGAIDYQLQGEWEHETLSLNFFASDVAQGGTLVIAGTYGGEIYRSTDEGLTWAYVGFSIPNADPVEGVFIDSRGYVFVGGRGGDAIYRSTDNGDNWEAVLTHGSNVNMFLSHNIVELPNGDLYFGTYTTDYHVPTVYRSTDGGANWESMVSFGSAGHIHTVKYDPLADRMWVWCGDYPSQGHDGFGFYWSDDYDSISATWHRTTITEGSLEDACGGTPNIADFTLHGDYIFFTRHWAQAQLYRADFSDPLNNPNPPVTEIWRGDYTLLNWAKYYNGWLLASGEADSGQLVLIGASETPPFDAGTWENIYEDGYGSTGRRGCAAISQHSSLNGWLFVSNTAEGHGIRIRIAPVEGP